MINTDLVGLLASYAYATCLLVVGEALRRWGKLPPALTRKFIHISAGMWVFGVMVLFRHWESGILPFATFILVNYLLYRYRIIGAMDGDENSPGTIYFALSVTLLFGLLWRPDGPVDRVHIATAGVMAMTWGDALAALVGKWLGRHRYKIWESDRSWEGSAAMFISSSVAIFLVLLLLPGSSLSHHSTPVSTEWALIAAIVGAASATVAEAISPHGTDNLSVPLVAAGAVGLVVQGF